ncbi:MAG: hypothetical protein SWO11_21400 [Thermodesulfobacteriota bacterium]|nr:hypothetical protein [Thermodesulfobacteriota bacterium]
MVTKLNNRDAVGREITGCCQKFLLAVVKVFCYKFGKTEDERFQMVEPY